jgi:dihydroorotate dehydrogenase (NAD+) catalytic subunit
MGGISSGRDAAEFILAGASAVAVGTALFVDPLAPVRILRELQEFMEARGWESVSGMVGRAREAVGGGGRAH